MSTVSKYKIMQLSKRRPHSFLAGHLTKHFSRYEVSLLNNEIARAAPDFDR